jgi:hypothetical protein
MTGPKNWQTSWNPALFLGVNNMMAYLIMMAVRLVEITGC